VSIGAWGAEQPPGKASIGLGAVEPAEQTVMGIARGYQLSQALYVAAKLGVADVVDPQPLAAEAIAHAVGARTSQLRRVLRALVAAGVFCELEDGRFASNDAAATLRADAPGRVRDVVLNFGEEMYRSFGELATPSRDRRRAAGATGDARARGGIPRRAGRGRSLRARRG